MVQNIFNNIDSIMNKKQYITPNVKFFVFHTCELLTVSAMGVNSSVELNGDEVLSRKSGWFDDDDDF